MVALGWYYIRWHYTQALMDLAGIIRNFVWFAYEVFSIPLLLRTLFVPFHRIQERTKGGFDPADWVQTKMVNGLMRFVGAIMRLFLVCIGCVVIAVVLFLGAAFFLTWLAAPLLLILLAGTGITLIAAA